MRGKEHNKLTIQRCSKLHDRLIKIALVLWRVGLRYIIGQVDQCLFMIFTDDGKGRADVRFQPEAPAPERKVSFYRQGRSSKNSTRIGSQDETLQKGRRLHILNMEDGHIFGRLRRCWYRFDGAPLRHLV